MDEILTAAQAAERLGMDPSSIRRLIIAGALPAEKFGRDWKIRAADLETLPRRPKGRPRRERDG